MNDYDVEKSLPSNESYAREIMSYGMSVKFDTVRIGEKYIIIKYSCINNRQLCKVIITGMNITYSSFGKRIDISYMPVNDIDKNDKYNDIKYNKLCEYIVASMNNSTSYYFTPYPTNQSDISCHNESWIDYIAIVKPYDINNPLTIRKMAPMLGLKDMVDAIIASRDPEEALERRGPLLAARSKIWKN